MKYSVQSITSAWLWIILAAFTAVVNILVFLIPDFNILKAGLALIWLFIIPGWLITRILHLRSNRAWEKLAFSVGFSVLAVMLVGLAMNTLLPFLGNRQPLATTNLLPGLDLAWLLLILVAWLRNRKLPLEIRVPRLPATEYYYLFAGLPIIALSALGATSLNNGGTNLWTFAMLLFAAGYLLALLRRRDSLQESTILTGIYSVALALLLMTSLRGWFTTGHDIQREYHVFILTLSALHWDVTSFKDAYNACLSITILPTTIQQITGINDLYIYKVVYQLIFAVVPVTVYLIARRYAGRLIAILAAIYFMAFPTYFTDMPMLNRQEIAFLFLSLMFLVMFNHEWTLKRQRILLIILGIGVILSHYSTTYTMIALIIMVISLRYLLLVLAALGMKIFGHRLDQLKVWRRPAPTALNLSVVTVLLISSYIWSVPLTNTGSNIAGVAAATLRSIQSGLAGDTKSSDTSYSFFGGSKLSDQQRLNAYVAQTNAATIAEGGSLYPAQTYAGYKPVVAKEANLPLTPAGNFLSRLGVDVSRFHTLTRQGTALILQLMLGLGLIIVFFRSPKKRLSNDYRLFQLASVLMIAAIVLLPVLSAQYGLLRAFQQALLIGGVPIVLASVAIIPRQFVRFKAGLGIICALTFLLSSTGVITTALGGYPPQLHLANSGKYYDLYYPHASEQQALIWLAETIGSNNHQTASVSTDPYTAGVIAQFADLSFSGSLYPSSVHQNSYIFLGYTTTVLHNATADYNGDPISYQYPVQYLDSNKDLLYANGSTKIYR